MSAFKSHLPIAHSTHDSLRNSKASQSQPNKVPRGSKQIIHENKYTESGLYEVFQNGPGSFWTILRKIHKKMKISFRVGVVSI